MAPEPVLAAAISPTARRRLLAAACAGMFMFGSVMALLGAILLPVAQRLNLSAARAGDIFLVMNFGIFLSQLVAGPAQDRFGVRPVLLGSSALAAAGMFALAASGSVVTLAVAVFIIGLGGGGLNTGTNTLVSDTFAEDRGSALNFLGIFFGFGAVALPFTLGAIAQRFTLGQILAGAALLPVACTIAYALLSFPPGREAHSFSLREAFGVIGRPAFLLLAIVFFFESGNEFTLNGWISTFIVKQTGSGVRLATFALAGYFAAIMAMRLVMSRVIRFVRAETLVIIAAAGVAAATAIFRNSTTPVGASVAALLVGAFVAPIYPAIITITGDRFPRFSGTVLSLLFSVALMGGMSGPWLVGHIADSSGYRTALAVTQFSALAVVAVSFLLRLGAPRHE